MKKLTKKQVLMLHGELIRETAVLTGCVTRDCWTRH